MSQRFLPTLLRNAADTINQADQADDATERSVGGRERARADVIPRKPAYNRRRRPVGRGVT